MIIKDRQPDGRRLYVVRVYLRGEHRTNVLFHGRALATLFAALLDLSVMHRSDPSAR